MGASYAITPTTAVSTFTDSGTTRVYNTLSSGFYIITIAHPGVDTTPVITFESDAYICPP